MHYITVLSTFLGLAAAAPEIAKRADGGAYFCAGNNWAQPCTHFTGDGCVNLDTLGWNINNQWPRKQIQYIGADQGYSCTLFTSRDCQYVDNWTCNRQEGGSCYPPPPQNDIGNPGGLNSYALYAQSIQCWN